MELVFVEVHSTPQKQISSTFKITNEIVNNRRAGIRAAGKR